MRTRRKVRFFAGILICAVLGPVWSQSDWQGSAVVGRYGEFPPNGFYAASSAFPLNSMVDVTNPATGDRARVVVVRELDDPGVFMVFSEAAAQELALEPGDSSTVRATPVQLPGLTAVSPNEDLPFHPDPDVNPAATFGDPNAALTRPPTASDTASDAVAQQESDAAPEAEAEPESDTEADADPEPEPEAEERIAEEPGPEVPEAEVRITELPLSSIEVEESSDTDTDANTAAAPDEAVAAEPVAEDPGSDALSVSIPVLPPESDPLPITELKAPDLPATDADTPTTPEVRIVVDVPEPELPPANPVRVHATIPDDERDTPRIAEAEEAMPRTPAEGEVNLPLVEVADVDTEREIAREPEETAPAASEEEPLRPGLIPENAIVSLEPAEFRSPDPPPEPAPQPETEVERPAESAESDAVPPSDGADAEPEQATEAEADANAEPQPEQAEEPEPELADAPTDDPAEEIARSLPLVERLDSGAAYVQVAAYSTPQSVRRTIDSLTGGWPVAVMAQKSGDRSVYRVYVGPLAEDEKGSVLYRVRNEGFRDAFVW